MGKAICSSQAGLGASSLMPTNIERIRPHRHDAVEDYFASSGSSSRSTNFGNSLRRSKSESFEGPRFHRQRSVIDFASSESELRSANFRNSPRHFKSESFRGSRFDRQRGAIAVASTGPAIPSLLRDLISPSLVCALIPVVLAIVVSKLLNLGLEQEVSVAVLRASAQLTILGFALKLVFERQNVFGCVFAMMVMVLVAGHTSGERAKALPRSKIVCTAALIGGAFSVIWLMVLLKVFPVQPKFLIPATGYLLGISMSAVATTLKSVENDVRVHEGEIEAALALGATPHQAVSEYLRRSLVLAMGPIFDHMKVSGLVTLPGAMAGMLMSGTHPLEAAASSLVLVYMLVGASSLTAVLGAQLGWRLLFTSSMQIARTS